MSLRTALAVCIFHFSFFILNLAVRGAISDGLIGYWTFDQTNGLVALDSTTNANHGALNGFPVDNSQWVSGRIGGALSFRGAASGDYVRVPNYPKPTSAMSVSMVEWLCV